MNSIETIVDPIGMFAVIAVVAVVIVVVLLGCITEIIRTYIKNRNSRLNAAKLEAKYYSKDELQPYFDKIGRLDERVRVLERIVTDKSHALAGEIDDLNDPK